VKVNVEADWSDEADTVELGSGTSSRSPGHLSLTGCQFQSMKLAFVVLSTSAVVCAVIFMLLVTRTTLNVQSFMEPSWPSGSPLRTPFC